MGNLLYKLSAIFVALAGAAMAAFALTAAYREDDAMLLALGMPASLLLPAVGALMVIVGVIMFVHAVKRRA